MTPSPSDADITSGGSLSCCRFVVPSFLPAGCSTLHTRFLACLLAWAGLACHHEETQCLAPIAVSLNLFRPSSVHSALPSLLPRSPDDIFPCPSFDTAPNLTPKRDRIPETRPRPLAIGASLNSPLDGFENPRRHTSSITDLAQSLHSEERMGEISALEMVEQSMTHVLEAGLVPKELTYMP